MMNNASLYFNGINSYEDIEGLCGKREDIFIDFKQTSSTTGRMTEDDKGNFCKAASGYAHQQGGVLVWGISTRKEDQEVSIATELKPISHVGIFCSALQSFIPAATDPYVGDIQHKVIYSDQESDTGFVVSLFPRSDKVHMSMYGKTKNAFYKRLGDGFHPLPTSEIEALFHRNLSPDLDLHTEAKNEVDELRKLSFSVKNRGKGMAKSCSVYLGITSDDKNMRTAWNLYELRPTKVTGHKELSEVVSLLKVLQSDKYTEHIKFNSGTVICPGEQVYIGAIWYTWKKDGFNEDINIKYKIFAENMIPKEGSIKNKN